MNFTRVSLRLSQCQQRLASTFSAYSTRITTTASLFSVSAFAQQQSTCSPSSTSKRRSSTTKGVNSQPEESIHEMVTDYYGKKLAGSKDLKTNACTASPPDEQIRHAMRKVPNEIKDKYYGCGSPLPLGIEGLTILDLGSGSGQDCYIAADLVGENGTVIGIDMTDNQLEVARKYVTEFCTETLNYSAPNMDFIKGYIELIDDVIHPSTIDLVISNCVVNLSPRKDQVLRGVWNCLKEGGEFYFSDVYCDRRLSSDIREHPVLVGECLGGALYIEDFRRLCSEIGFNDARVLKMDEIKVTDKELKSILGNAKFYSITYRLFKCEEIEDRCEDYGQIGIYNGSIQGHELFYDLDNHHRFYKNKPMLICANTANMISGESWLNKHFTVIGDTNGEHFGLFDCTDSSVTVESSDQNSSSNTGGGSCC